MSTHTRPYNFGAGPSMLPLPVLQQIQEELLDWHKGISVLEFGHRTPEFEELAKQSEADLRSLLAIPEEFAVLFMHGGGRGQFAALPLNLLAPGEQAGYLNSGFWSEKAAEEASKFGSITILAEDPTHIYTAIPDVSTWKDAHNLAYVHYADNETIQGLEFSKAPVKYSGLLVSDMTSNLLTRPIEWQHFKMVYAGAQKTLGIAGMAVVIIRRDCLNLTKTRTDLPSILNYTLWEKSRSLYNTPPVFAWYVSSLILKWLIKEGGVAKMQSLAQVKAKLLYEAIDSTDFYINKVAKHERSRLNIPFSLVDASLEAVFLEEAAKVGLLQLAGHKIVGGLRASLYTAMPIAGVEALVEFMRGFELRYKK